MPRKGIQDFPTHHSRRTVMNRGVGARNEESSCIMMHPSWFDDATNRGIVQAHGAIDLGERISLREIGPRQEIQRAEDEP